MKMRIDAHNEQTHQNDMPAIDPGFSQLRAFARARGLRVRAICERAGVDPSIWSRATQGKDFLVSTLRKWERAIAEMAAEQPSIPEGE